MQNITEDFFLPVRGGDSGTQIDTTPGLTYESIEDIDYLKNKLKEITAKILDIYDRVEFSEEDIQQIIDLMKYDKKNSHGNINSPAHAPALTFFASFSAVLYFLDI